MKSQNLSLKPGLAKSCQAKNETTLVLHLNEGAKFHNAPPFDAAAANSISNRYRTDPRSNVKADLNADGNIEAAGKSEVVPHLTRPNAGLPAILTTARG